jgi:hypothetical protein
VCADTLVIDLRWRDVMSATEPPVKKNKAAPKAVPDTAATETSQNKLFVLNYIEKQKKSNKLQHRSITLQSVVEPVENWLSLIEEKRKEGTVYSSSSW